MKFLFVRQPYKEHEKRRMSLPSVIVVDVDNDPTCWAGSSASVAKATSSENQIITFKYKYFSSLFISFSTMPVNQSLISSIFFDEIGSMV